MEPDYVLTLDLASGLTLALLDDPWDVYKKDYDYSIKTSACEAFLAWVLRQDVPGKAPPKPQAISRSRRSTFGVAERHETFLSQELFWLVQLMGWKNWRRILAYLGYPQFLCRFEKAVGCSEHVVNIWALRMKLMYLLVTKKYSSRRILEMFHNIFSAHNVRKCFKASTTLGINQYYKQHKLELLGLRLAKRSKKAVSLNKKFFTMMGENLTKYNQQQLPLPSYRQRHLLNEIWMGSKYLGRVWIWVGKPLFATQGLWLWQVNPVLKYHGQLRTMQTDSNCVVSQMAVPP